MPLLQKRKPVGLDVSDYDAALAEARRRWGAERHLEAIDAFELILAAHPKRCVDLLSELYDLYDVLPGKESRYTKYQRRHFDFGIKPGARVLDIGSGHNPFPYATHLAEYSIQNADYGRAGIPFKFVEGKPVIQCSVEALPFEDKFFDFVYCSHVLEHVYSPHRACAELTRVAKRGYCESPSRSKDLWLHQARVSNHHWWLEHFNGKIVFSEYSEADIEGLTCDVLMKFAVAPKSPREKAFSALLFLKADFVNTMWLWEEDFEVEVRRRMH